jgi:aminobenzoyl-glutamate utilization protein B
MDQDKEIDMNEIKVAKKDLVSELEGLVESEAAAFTELADAIWDCPEMSWAEFDAVQRHIGLAEKYRFRVKHNLANIPTAFCAEFGQGGPVIAFLGEYDSLTGLSQQSGANTPIPDPANTSGNGQGCAHHLLGAGSLLAAVTTAAYLHEHGISGRVRYYGCPAEESGSGKTFMVREGALNDVDAAVTWHPGTELTARQWLALATMDVYFTFRGVAAHAADAPEAGRSALDAVELMNVGVNFLREHMTDSCRVHYAITDAGGTSPNVVQARATAFYTVRAKTVAETRELYDRVVKIAQGAALMTETSLEIEFDGGSAPILPNDVLEQALQRRAESFGSVPFDAEDQATARKFTDILSAAKLASAKQSLGLSPDDPRSLHDELLGFDPATPRSQPTGSSDVGDVSWVTPTVQLTSPCISIGAPPHSWLWVAQGKLPAAHKGMVHAAKIMAATATDLFTNPDLLRRARSEFNATTEQSPYDSPIPGDVLPPPTRTVK